MYSMSLFANWYCLPAEVVDGTRREQSTSMYPGGTEHWSLFCPGHLNDLDKVWPICFMNVTSKSYLFFTHFHNAANIPSLVIYSCSFLGRQKSLELQEISVSYFVVLKVRIWNIEYKKNWLSIILFIYFTVYLSMESFHNSLSILCRCIVYKH